MPRAAAAARRLYHEHALHALVGAIPEWHAGANDVVQDAADAGMGHGGADDRAVDMRLPQVHVASEKPFVILGPVDRLDLVAPGHSLNGRVRVVAPIDPPQLTRNLGAGGLVHQAGDQHVPALDVGSPQFISRGLRRIERRDCHRIVASRNPIAMGKGATTEPLPSTPAWEESAASLNRRRVVRPEPRLPPPPVRACPDRQRVARRSGHRPPLRRRSHPPELPPPVPRSHFYHPRRLGTLNDVVGYVSAEIAGNTAPVEVFVWRLRLRISTSRSLRECVEERPRVAGHRITVANIVICHERLGKSADEIATEYDLTLADVYVALAYYFDNREAIDESIAKSKALVPACGRRTFPHSLRGFRNESAVARIRFYRDRHAARAAGRCDVEASMTPDFYGTHTRCST